MFIERYQNNPFLKPKAIHSWEAEASFNCCPIRKGKKIYILYRALSLPHYHSIADKVMTVSSIGVVSSGDGIDFHDRKRFITPEYDWERFGCEDPRVTRLNDKYYIFYTALSTYPPTPEGIKVGLAISKDLKTVVKKHLITPFNAKAMALFPEKIEGKIWAILTVHSDKPPAKICLVSFEKEEEMWSEEFWLKWYEEFEKYALSLKVEPQDHIEVGAQPLKTKCGWLLLYCYIKDYFTPQRLFGVKVALLDLKNPFKIIGQLPYPILYPEEYYERIGLVSNVIFPSGALTKKNKIYLYYGTADNTCSLAFIDLNQLLKKLLKEITPPKFVRPAAKPIITPNPEHSWEAKATFNPAAIYLNGKVHLIYRAMSYENTSVFGYATSKDGINIEYRSPVPIYVPRAPFESKTVPGVFSGCEDPRLTKIDNRIYMCYTAFNGKTARVALTWIKVKDFLDQKWNWASPVPISPPNIWDKNACIFPEKVNGQYFILHRVSDDIDSALVPTLEFKGDKFIEEYRWIKPRPGWWDSKKVGIAAPPIETKEGWILLYHGVSDDNVYRVGAILLDLENPLKIVARSDEPLFEPELPYEKEGQVSNVVFPCGAVKIKDKIFIYYGAADQVIGVATISTKELLKYLKSCLC